MAQMLCPSHEEDLTLVGYEGAEEWNHLELKV